MSFYTVKINSAPMNEKTLSYMDKLFERKISSDARLNLFMEKGFLLWSMGKTDMALNTFRLKINAKFIMKSMTFKEKLKEKYKYYKDQEIEFPEQKATWKKIKKLKIIEILLFNIVFNVVLIVVINSIFIFINF